MRDVRVFLQVKPVRRLEHLSFNLISFRFFRNSEDGNRLSLGSLLLLSPLTVIPYILATEVMLFRRKRYFVKLKEQVVGILVLRDKSNALYISSLAVAPEYRRLGIAVYMLNYVDQVAKRLDKKWLELSVFKGNNAALRLYEKDGFTKKKEGRWSFILRREVKSK